MKKKIEESDLEENQEPLNCRSLRKIKLKNSKHFDAEVSLEYSSVHVVAEVFDCGKRINTVKLFIGTLNCKYAIPTHTKMS